MHVNKMYALFFCTLALMGGAFMGAAVEVPQSVQVTIKGFLHEDKNGFFFKIDGVVYDISFHDDNKADMQKFYTGLQGDLVKVSGDLHVQEVKDGKPYLVVYTNDIARLKNETKVVVREGVVERPVVVREYYVEHPRGINLPFVHINW